MIGSVEVSPASEWCQRWEGGTHTWRHRRDGGFDASRYEVEAIDETAAKRYVLGHHYSGSYPASRLRYGLFEDGVLLGVLVFGVPTQRAVLTNVFTDLEPYQESLELSRLVLADRVPANGESWFLAQCFREAAAVGLRGVVSFADPVPRIVDGKVLFPGHIGHVYMASNATYCGRGTARTLALLPDGRTINHRSMQKVRKQERGHDHVERQLVAMGAPVMLAGERPVDWLNRVLPEITTPLRHRGNHRYVFRLGTRAQRRRTRIAIPSSPFPKERDAA